jgi:hypothetical protein
VWEKKNPLGGGDGLFGLSPCGCVSFLAGVGCFAGVAGESLLVQATRSNQETRRLSGWQSIPRRWFFERLRFPFDVVGRSTLLRILSGASVDGLLDEPDFRLLAAC